MTLMEVNGKALPAPVSDGYTITLSDIDSSNTGRSESGVMFRDRMRAGVYKLEVTWEMPLKELTEVLSIISPAKFRMKFFDITTGSFVTRDMYVGDRSGSILNYLDEGDTDSAMCQLTCNFVEF